VVDDVLGVKSRVFQTACLECQKPISFLSGFMPVIDSRALLVTVVAPSKRPVTLHYGEKIKKQGERTLGGENFLDLKGILVVNGVTGDVNSPPTGIDNDNVLANLEGVSHR
jgi:hypothetical protein